MKLALKIIGGLLFVLFLVVGGILPLLPKQLLSSIPQWAEWPILICGGLFIVYGFFLGDHKN